jgi:putative addiction module component (TIGR02574 family)
MAVDMKALLALPQKQRRKIAEKLWQSLDPAENINSEDASIITLLEKRKAAADAGKTKPLSSAQFWAKVESYIHTGKK